MAHCEHMPRSNAAFSYLYDHDDRDMCQEGHLGYLRRTSPRVAAPRIPSHHVPVCAT